jgi:hypothetical protein
LVFDLVPAINLTLPVLAAILGGKTFPGHVRVWTLPRPPVDDAEWGEWMETIAPVRLPAENYNFYTHNCIHYARDHVGAKNP